jgi:hypothetical protein
LGETSLEARVDRLDSELAALKALVEQIRAELASR